MRKLLILILSSLMIIQVFSQSYAAFRSFTTADGLPSNHIYKTIEDDKGFLWVATDAGIARFDGKYFQVFTTQNGLPDNEVLDVTKEKDGTIWVNCFKQSPAFFDEIRNRFINVNTSPYNANVKDLGIMNMYTLPKGGILYNNSNGSYVFNNRHVKFYPADRATGKGLLINLEVNKKLNSNSSSSEIYFFSEANSNGYTFFFSTIRNNRLKESRFFLKTGIENIQYYLDEGIFYFVKLKAGICYTFSNFTLNPFGFQKDSIIIGEPVKTVSFFNDLLSVATISGNILGYNKKSHQKDFFFNGNFIPNTLMKDSKDNIWVSTIDKGLILYKKKQIESVLTPDYFYNTHFLSIAKKKDGSLLAGNFNSQVVTTNGKSFLINLVQTNNTAAWQRKVILSQDKVFSFSESGTYINFTKPLKNPTGIYPYFTKTAVVLNDSIIISGSLSGLDKINTIHETSQKLSFLKKRVTAITVAANRSIYFGSTDGLYRYDLIENKTIELNKQKALFSERITCLTSTSDSLVWIGTADNGIIVISADSVKAHFTTRDGLISNDCRSISTGRNGQVWLGTNQGISILHYQLNATSIGASVQNLSINDGLSNNLINEMLFDKDTVYAATGNGINIIPASILIPKYDIPVRLTNVKVNQRDTAVLTNFNLAYDQNNIQLQFAAIEPGGHFKNLQYTINDNANWNDLDENLLSLQLGSGSYRISVRAIDVNGNAGKTPLILNFSVATPYWRSLGFWLAIVIVLVTLAGLGILEFSLRKRKAAIKELENKQLLQELEMQSIKAQMNPHFVFNCLSSIKSLTYQQKTEAAGLFIDRFSFLVRNTLEYAASNTISLQQELHYIENYLLLEQLRFGSKLKWQIEVVDPSINTSTIQVPSLLLQPYVENAIKHGINHLTDENGLIRITIKKEFDFLVYKIEDNGIGREASTTINSRQLQNHISKGMLLSQRRAELYGIQSEISDKKDSSGKTNGTWVILKIPLT